MAVGKFMRSGGMAALAAALAVLALPVSAQAQERGHGRWNRGGEATEQSNNDGDNWRGNRGERRGDDNGGGRRWNRSEQPATPQAQAQPHPRSQRDWSRGDGNDGGRWNRGNDGGGNRGMGWRGRDRGQAQTEAVPAPQAPVRVQRERRNWSDNDQWQGRNRDAVRRHDDGVRWRSGDYDSRWRNDNLRRGDDRWRGDNDNRWRGDRQNYGYNWNRDWRRDHRYDWRGYRNSHRHTYRLGAYYAPYWNYSYRRLSVGYYLDTLFFGSRYWIDDPWQYRLPPAYGPYRWVRYYDDALLVDTYSGEVVDVIYDFFW